MTDYVETTVLALVSPGTIFPATPPLWPCEPYHPLAILLAVFVVPDRIRRKECSQTKRKKRRDIDLAAEASLISEGADEAHSQ